MPSRCMSCTAPNTQQSKHPVLDGVRLSKHNSSNITTDQHTVAAVSGR
jgi:hypothetical protein